MRKPAITIVLGSGVGMLAMLLGTTTPAAALSPVAASPYQEAQEHLVVAVELENQGFAWRQEALEEYKARIAQSGGMDAQAAAQRHLAETKLTAGPATRDDAKPLLTEAIELHAAADGVREDARDAYEGTLSTADNIDNQAAVNRRIAQETLQEAGFRNQARAITLRMQGHALRVQAQNASGLAEADLLVAASLRTRSPSVRQTAKVIRASSPDTELRADATALEKFSYSDLREAQRLSSEAKALASRSRSAARLADSYDRNADRIDPGGL